MDIGKIKTQLKNSKTFGPLYECLKSKKTEWQRRSRLRGNYTFEDRSKGSDRLCIVLAGYKEYLYPAVFGRLEKYAPTDMDICIMTSGIYSEKMSKRCADKGWSYLSTKRNNVSLIQNIAIHLHSKAEYIFKLDEDIFITEGYFENILRAYHHAAEGDYEPGVIAPLIPINPYGNVRVLEKFGLIDIYTKLFEKPKYLCDWDAQYHANPQAAKFFWGEGGYVPSIDNMNRRVVREPIEEYPCAVRFSIGAIMFTRGFWDAFGTFSIPLKSGFGGNMGSDETEICAYCMNNSRPIMVSENVLVGHLGYLPQNAAMREYYLNHQKRFMPPVGDNISL